LAYFLFKHLENIDQGVGECLGENMWRCTAQAKAFAPNLLVKNTLHHAMLPNNTNVA